MAQGETEDNSPQVLTSDLIEKQVITTSNINVTFVVVDSDDVAMVVIDGEEQKFTPSDTVQITKNFQFSKGRHLIRVYAEDTRGNKRERTYLVAFGVPLEKKKGSKKPWRIVTNVSVAKEQDSNPSSDLSLPLPIPGFEGVTGVVPDSEQMDTRTRIQGAVVGAFRSFAMLTGVQTTTYSKTDNTPFNTRGLFIGGLYNVNLSKGSNLRFGYTLMDLDVGGFGYAQFDVLSFTWEGVEKSPVKIVRDQFVLELIKKAFALGYDPDNPPTTLPLAKVDGWVHALKWIHRSVEQGEERDTFKGVLSGGLTHEGTDESRYSYMGYDAAWGLKYSHRIGWNLGFGLQYRNYSFGSLDLAFGSKRIDIPIRFGTGVSWGFLENMGAGLDYQYISNASNKNPFVRKITSLKVNGRF